MKRKSWILMTVLLMTLILVNIIPGVVLSEADHNFKYKRLERLNGYEFDKKSQTWGFHGSFGKEWEGTAFTWIISVRGDMFGTFTFGQPLMVLQRYSDDRGYDIIHTFIVAIDEKVYSYEKITDTGEGWSMLFLGHVGIDMIRSIAKAKEVTILLAYTGYTSTIEVKMSDFKKMKTWAQNFVKEDIASFYDENELTWADYQFNAIVE